MRLTDEDVEHRLRRTFTAVAEAPLQEEVVEATSVSAHRTRRRVALAVAAAAVVGAGLAVAIAARSTRTNTVADGGPGSRPTLAGYLPTPEEKRILFEGEQRVLHRCMEAAGEPYEEVEPRPDNDLDPHWNRLGRTDAARAERLGYEVPNGPGGANPALLGLTDDASREAWSQAFNGEQYSQAGAPTGPSVPIVDPVTGEENGRQSAGGCFGAVQRQLYGDQSRHTSLENFVANEIGNRLEQAIIDDRRFHDAVEAWKRCMDDLGYDYQSPFAPIQQFGVDVTAAGPSAKERRTAVDDVSCKRSSRLLTTYDQLEVEHGAALAEEFQPFLREFRTLTVAAERQARQILQEK